MNRIVLIDKRQNFLSDVNTRMIMDDERSFTIETVLSEATAIWGVIDQYKPTMLVISENMIEDMPDWDFPIPVVMYASDALGMKKINEVGFDSYGIVISSQDLLDAIDNNRIYKASPSNMSNIPGDSNKNVTDQLAGMESSAHLETNNSNNVPLYGQPISQMQQNVPNGQFPSQGGNIPYPYLGQPPYPSTMIANQGGAMLPYNPYNGALANQNQIFEQPQASLNGMYPPYGYFYMGTQNPGTQTVQMLETNPNNIQPIISNPNINNRIAGVVSKALDNSREERMKQFVDEDAALSEEKTRIISTYSAKGGVGKTTIAKELATYLACTSKDGERYKVCIVDFNVDFGDVLTVLDYKTNVKAMIDWIHDIRNRLTKIIKDKGMNVNDLDSDSVDEIAENIVYTTDEIYEYLQKDERTGLYALTAPTEHEDTMDIQQRETYVILNAIKNCGEFDFIICDTGNNTRDTTFNALELSDLVLLVCTQDTTTANDNDAFLSAAEKIGFDSSKIKIVINAIRPQTQMGISVQEVEQCFNKYECYGRIKYDPVIAKSNNSGAPLVIQKKQPEFTASIAEIAEHILGKKCTTSKPKKSSFFDFFKKK